MHLKINGYVTPEILKDYFESLISLSEEKTGKKVFCSGLDIYLRMEDEDSKQFDIIENNRMFQVELPDRYEQEVLIRLNKQMKQVDIALELGINQNRVSKIKKKLAAERKIDFFYTDAGYNLSPEELEFVKMLRPFIEEESFAIVERDNSNIATKEYIARELSLKIEEVEVQFKGLKKSKVLSVGKSGESECYFVNPVVLGRKGNRVTNLMFKTGNRKASNKRK